MKKRIILSVCSGFILSCVIQTAKANNIPAHSLPVSQILKNLQNKGFKNIREVKFDDGIYEVEALDDRGNGYVLRVYPTTGELIKNQKIQNNAISTLEVAQKIEAEGYRFIYKIESHGSHYDVEALSKEDKKVELKIDADTGKITHE
ncbi:TPA: PepSY domain-containing protein [Legionella pneumophila subsp. pneumophila]|nr:PepSY domain-containing protein [Legionella pneumophila subsp. pneumophila]